MKRLGRVWGKITSMDNLREAHKRASRDKGYYKEVKMVNKDPDFYLSEIQKMLVNGTYTINESDYTSETINDKGKERHLMKLPYYPHRIIQWAIMLQIEPTFINTFCYHTCASIPERGIKRARNLTEKYLKDKNNVYCLKIDIRHFYESIDQTILKQLLRKKFKDIYLLNVLDIIIDSYKDGVGVPIGSYLSQYLANFYLCYFDHWLKEIVKTKAVVRYMDDMVIIATTKSLLWFILQKIDYRLTELRLTLKPNYQIFPIKARGIDFVGFRFFGKFRLIRKKTIKRVKTLAIKIYHKQQNHLLINYHEFCGLCSYLGLFQSSNSFKFFERYITPIIKSLLLYYRYVIIKGSDKADKKIIKFRRKVYKKQIRRAA